MAVTGLTSDNFKFHLRKLIKLRLVDKNDDGLYELTAEGKEFANRFDYENRSPIHQPKLTTATFVWRLNLDTNEIEYLFHQRLRQPFYGYWGVIGEPVRWGETFENAAMRGLLKQTGLKTPLALKAFYRQRDMKSAEDKVLEDKLFVVLSAEWQGQELSNWSHANAEWMTIDVLSQQPKRFDSCLEMLKTLSSDQIVFKDGVSNYLNTDY